MSYEQSSLATKAVSLSGLSLIIVHQDLFIVHSMSKSVTVAFFVSNYLRGSSWLRYPSQMVKKTDCTLGTSCNSSLGGAEQILKIAPQTWKLLLRHPLVSIIRAGRLLLNLNFLLAGWQLKASRHCSPAFIPAYHPPQFLQTK